MSIIVKKPWTRQPPTPVGIDSGNPLTRGLVSVITPTQKKPTVISGEINTSANPKGIAFDGTMRLEGSTSYEVSGSTVLTFIRTKELTSSLIVAASNTAATNRIWLGMQSDNTLIVSNSQGGGDFVVGNAAAHTDYVIVHTMSGGVGSGYLNGNFVISGTHNSTGVGNLTAMSYGGGGYSWPHKSYLTSSWNRVLSNAEIKSVSANPWQIFEPQRRILFAPSVVGGGFQAAWARNSNIMIQNGSE